MNDATETISVSQWQKDGTVGSEPEPYLVIVIVGLAPMTRSSRFSLAGIDTVHVARGETFESKRTGRELRITVPDRSMSGGAHARVFKSGKSWVIEDCDSKNGTILNGNKATRNLLVDGDIVDVGSTVFLFRDQVLGDARDSTVDEAPNGRAYPSLATLNPALERNFANLVPIARSSSSIMVQGETGTGKEVVAKEIHRLSGRSGAFVAVNCGAIAHNLIESEFFGHVKGAFSGAVDDNVGYVRRAEGGTLFFDEIAELPEPAQVKLLRILEEGVVVPVGSSLPIKVDIRFVAATHQNLEQRIDHGLFRKDLFARIASYRITLPPLSERKEDVGLLVGNMLRQLPAASTVRLKATAARALVAYDWPLNVRELSNTLLNAITLADGGSITPDHLPAPLQTGLAELHLRRDRLDAHRLSEKAEAREKRLKRLRQLAAETSGNVSEIARRMNTYRSKVRAWCQEAGIDLSSYRDDGQL